MQLSWQVFSFRHLQLCPLRPNHSYDKGKKLLVPAITCNKLELIQKWRFCYKFKSDKKTNYSFKFTHKTMCYFPSLQFFSGEVRLCVDHLDCKIKRGDAWENHASYTKLSRGTSAVLSWYWNRETNVGSAPTKKGQYGKWSWEVKRSNMFEQVKKEKRKPKKLSSWQHLREMSCRWKFFWRLWSVVYFWPSNWRILNSRTHDRCRKDTETSIDDNTTSIKFRGHGYRKAVIYRSCIHVKFQI